MNVFKKALMMLTLGVGSLFIGASAADAQWGYRSYGYGGYAPRTYGGGYGSYYGNPYGGYRNYGYRGYGGRNFYNNRGFNNRGFNNGGSGVFLGRGGLGIRF